MIKCDFVIAKLEVFNNYSKFFNRKMIFLEKSDFLLIWIVLHQQKA